MFGKSLGGNKYVAGAAAASALAALGLTMSKLLSPYVYSGGYAKLSDPMLGSGSYLNPSISNYYQNSPSDSLMVSGSSQTSRVYPGSIQMLPEASYDANVGQFEAQNFYPTSPVPMMQPDQQLYFTYKPMHVKRPITVDADTNGHYTKFYSHQPDQSMQPDQFRPSFESSAVNRPQVSNLDSSETSADQMILSSSLDSPSYVATNLQSFARPKFPSSNSRRSGAVTLKMDQQTRAKLQDFMQKQRYQQQVNTDNYWTSADRSSASSSSSFVPMTTVESSSSDYIGQLTKGGRLDQDGTGSLHGSSILANLQEGQTTAKTAANQSITGRPKSSWQQQLSKQQLLEPVNKDSFRPLQTSADKSWVSQIDSQPSKLDSNEESWKSLASLEQQAAGNNKQEQTQKMDANQRQELENQRLRQAKDQHVVLSDKSELQLRYSRTPNQSSVKAASSNVGQQSVKDYESETSNGASRVGMRTASSSSEATSGKAGVDLGELQVSSSNDKQREMSMQSITAMSQHEGSPEVVVLDDSKANLIQLTNTDNENDNKNKAIKLIDSSHENMSDGGKLASYDTEMLLMNGEESRQHPVVSQDAHQVMATGEESNQQQQQVVMGKSPDESRTSPMLSQ